MSIKKLNESKKGGFDMELSQLVLALKESVTMKCNAQAKSVKDVINLTAGEPDFEMPKAAQKAVIEAVKAGKTKYTPAKGTAQLRQAIALNIKKNKELVYDPEKQTAVFNGGKEAIMAALLAIVNPGDEVIIISPCWTSYPEMVKLCRAVPVFFDIRKGIGRIEKVLSAKTKLLILNSPNNPTGQVFTFEETDILASILVRHKISVIADEIYSALVFSGNKHYSISGFKGMYEKTIVTDGASKVFAMTGERIGWASGPEAVIAKMTALKSQMSGCPPATGQEAALAALEQSAEDVELMRTVYEGRCQQFVLPFAEEMAASFPDFEYFVPQGAFYFFFKIPSVFKGTCEDFFEKLLAQTKVALVPGSAFGYPGWMRLSFAASDDEIIKGLAGLAAFLNKFK